MLVIDAAQGRSLNSGAPFNADVIGVINKDLTGIRKFETHSISN